MCVLYVGISARPIMRQRWNTRIETRSCPVVHWASNHVTIKARGSLSVWLTSSQSSWVQMPSTKLQFIIGLISTIMAVGRSLRILKFASQWHDNGTFQGARSILPSKLAGAKGKVVFVRCLSTSQWCLWSAGSRGRSANVLDSTTPNDMVGFLGGVRVTIDEV